LFTLNFLRQTSQILNTGINIRDAITLDGDVRLTVI
jgi:hypothetical protein